MDHSAGHFLCPWSLRGGVPATDRDPVGEPESLSCEAKALGNVHFAREEEDMDREDRRFMERAIELARLGRGWTSPNPMVGAVIVKDGKVIGEGYHARCGGPHAERNAIASLTEPARGATLYVTLEPCCHTGKTPPCTEAILEQGISRVVIGSRDPNPKVAGKGAEILRRAKVAVEEDFMREECDRLNPVFFHYITTGTPYVVMKYAMTLDGKIATRTGESKWITGEKARRQVQWMRHGYTGIMAGIGTVLADDPMLNVRLTEENPAGKGLGWKNPVRIICDSRLRIPSDSKICRTAKEYQTIVAHGSGTKKDVARLEDLKIQVVHVPDQSGQVDLRGLMKLLGSQGIDSILLEGGGELNESAFQAGIVHEVQAFVAPKIFGGREAKTPVTGLGVALPGEARMLSLENVSQLGEDLLLEYGVKGGEE